MKIDDKRRIAIKPDGTKIPVVDSKITGIIQPNEDDIKNGIPGDHANCMYCLACRRMYGSQLVWVTRTLAYVEMKGKGGVPQLMRFILKSPAKDETLKFDTGGQITAEAVIFAAPTGKKTLGAQDKTWHDWKTKQESKSEPRKKAYVKGKIKSSKKKIDHSIEPLGIAIRSRATGMFNFKKES